MRVNNFPDYYVMITLLDDGDYPTFNRPRHVNYDGCARCPFTEGLATKLAVADIGRSEKGEG